MSEEQKRNIILIGFMGSGKTSVGRQLAQQLSYRFYDTDQLLEERAKDTISHIFSEHGEEYFRDMETELLRELAAGLNETVLATGGGLPLREQNAKLLQDIGYVIFLKASRETIVERLKEDITRPLLQGEELEQRVDRLLKGRLPFYEKAAHKIITTDNRTVDEIAASVAAAYSKVI